jgi:hypothetical protein
VIQNDKKIDINVVGDEAIHHDSIVVLKVFIWLVVLAQHPVGEEVHVE